MTKTAKGAKAPAKKKGETAQKNPPAASGAPQTGDLPLKGAKDGVTQALDNSRPIKTPIPPEVINKAKLFAQARDRMEVYKAQTIEHGDELLDMMLKAALPADVRLRVDTDRGVRFISYRDTGVSLVVESAKGRPAEEPKPEPKKDAAKDGKKPADAKGEKKPGDAKPAADKKPEPAGKK